MKNGVRILLLGMAVLVIPALAHAKAKSNLSGCTDSPESPTLVLALAASAGGALSSARNRWKNRKNNKNDSNNIAE